MTIQFNQIPPGGQLRAPLFYAELNGAQTPFVTSSRLLVLGQIHPSVINPGVAQFVQADPLTLFGECMLTDSIRAARANAPLQEIWALPFVDSAVGTKANATLVLTLPIGVQAKTTGDVTLAGGAPLVADGLTLKAGDLVFANDQADTTENGIYTVQTLGTGSNGTWVRATVMDTDDELFTGMIVAVAGGVQGGLSWQLGTAGPFAIDTTPLSFVQTLYPRRALTQPQTVALWVGDVQIQTIVYHTDTPTTFGARVFSAINAVAKCQMKAISQTGGVIELEAKHAGTAANSIYLDTDYYGSEGPLAASLFQITQPSGGSGDPDVAAALVALSDEPFDWIVGPYGDAVTLAAMQDFLSPVSGRWSPFKQVYGHYLGMRNDSLSSHMTFASTQNAPTTSTMSSYRAASPVWKWAGALGGRMAAHLSDAPELARPLQTLDLISILPPKNTGDRSDLRDRNTGYFAGVSNYHVDGKTKTASIDRIVTHYRLNEWGSPDASWLDVETRAKVMYSVRGMRAAITGQFPRATLVDQNPDGIAGVATVDDIRDVLIHEYKRQTSLLVVENPEVFAASLIVERNQQDATRVDVLLPADMSNELRIFALNYTSFLQRAA